MWSSHRDLSFQQVKRKYINWVKALYGLKHAPRAWYNLIDDYMVHQDFQKSKSAPTLHINIHGSLMIVSLYVDDLLATRIGEFRIKKIEFVMQK